MTTNKQQLFIVVYDDQQGLCNPMSWSTECEGALDALTEQPVACFPTRQAARKAIDISAKFAALRKAQGKPDNTDFLEGRSNVRVVECTPPATTPRA